MRYFIVKTKCGHVGRFNCVWIDYAIVASDAKTAALYAKSKARVKKHHKDVIAGVREVNFESFMKQRAENDADPYLHCKNPQEQKKIPDFDSRIIPDIREIQMKKKVSTIRHQKMIHREAEIRAELRDYYRGEYIA